jgi:REP element-mobilizing transposase RayT
MPRLEFPHAIYHVTSRGNARQRIVRDDADRQAWLTVLGHVVGRFGWLCHAYCLMNNHYHLLIETPRPNLSRGMRQLVSPPQPETVQGETFRQCDVSPSLLSPR